MISLGGDREEERRCVSCSTGQLLIVQLPTVTITVCLLSSETINNNLKRRRTSNQQSTSMAARESNKQQQSQRLWEYNNQSKDQLQRWHQIEWGQRNDSKDDSKDS